MNFDMQMARGQREGEFNLAVGEPIFLQETYLKAMPPSVGVPRYQYPQVGGEDWLVLLLKKMHRQYKHVVVTNGGKQAIEASFYAFRTEELRETVHHEPPFWPSYPTLAAARGLLFNASAPRRGVIRVTTSPNNPDGCESNGEDYDLWDAAYAQPLYGYSGIPPVHRVAVYSAAKMFGLSGARVGWLCTNDDSLATAAARFVELTTSGVSTFSQGVVRSAIETAQDPGVTSMTFVCLNQARESLLMNGMLFAQLMQGIPDRIKGLPVTGKGMFAWFRVADPVRFNLALSLAGVKLVTGEACGEVQPGWYRMSMGHRNDVTREALTKLREVYFK